MFTDMESTMTDYTITGTSTIKFHELYRAKDDGSVLVGREDIASYMSIPAEAVEVIDLLNEGKTVAEVENILEEKYGEEVEIREFIEDMASNDLIAEIDGISLVTTSQEQKAFFTSIQGKHVGWMFSRYAEALYLVVAFLCLAIFVIVPEYIPQPRDLFFHPWYSVAMGLMFFFSWILVAVHELAHLFAAKSVGTEGSFSLGHRLVFIVAQTTLGNIWTVPRKKRYVVYVAGMAWDVILVFICLILLLVSDNGIMVISPIWYLFLKALIFIKVWGIIWQFRFNMQTDVYYVVSNYFNCKNLLSDAQTLIKNGLSRVFGKITPVDMSHIPEKEMKAIKWYSLFYFVGTIVTLATYVMRNIPLLILQIQRAIEGITAGSTDPVVFWDAVVLIGLNVFNYGVLGYMVLKPRWGTLKQRICTG